MDIQVLHKDKNEVVFILKDINPAVANTVRRLVLEEVPTLAIEDITISKNDSPLYDEIVAHRMGLIPLKTDLDYYEFPKEGKESPKYQVNFSLKVKGPATVYAENIEFDDKKVVSLEPKIPIVMLLKEQKLELEGFAVLGRGRDHMKFSPAHIYYRGVPEFEVAGNVSLKKIIEACNGALKEKGKGLEVIDFTKWNDAYEEICEKNGVKINYSDKDFIFYIESWGQVEIPKILEKATSIFDEKLDELDTEVKKAK
ncbi:MAG: DNA-directed RNA polymerase subunit D [Candidatus Nanoarchaeia archaeon]|nr:DNA-directed RNA polymerase subunit D [Candidatus Nanoarchaeia archaeon]